MHHLTIPIFIGNCRHTRAAIDDQSCEWSQRLRVVIKACQWRFGRSNEWEPLSTSSHEVMNLFITIFTTRCWRTFCSFPGRHLEQERSMRLYLSIKKRAGEAIGASWRHLSTHLRISAIFARVSPGRTVVVVCDPRSKLAAKKSVLFFFYFNLCFYAPLIKVNGAAHGGRPRKCKLYSNTLWCQCCRTQSSDANPGSRIFDLANFTRRSVCSTS